MKKLLAIILFVTSLNAYSQNTTTLPSPTTSFVPSFRYYGTLTDSLRQTWFATSTGGWNRLYTATEANLRFGKLVGGNIFTGNQTFTGNGSNGLYFGYGTIGGGYGGIWANALSSKTLGNVGLLLYDGLTSLNAGGTGSMVDININGNQKLAVDANGTYIYTAPTANDMPLRYQDSTIYVNPTRFNTLIGTATQSALNLKAPIASPTFTGTANFGGDITAASLVLNGTNPVTQFGSRYAWQASTNGAGFPLNHFRLHDLIADSSRITVSNYGKVGINKSDATEFLDVNGNVTSNGHYYAGTRARDGIAQYYSGEVINAHAHYAFLANDSVRYTTPALYGQAAFNDNRSYYGSEDSDHEHSFQSYIHKYGSGTSSRISSFFSQPDIQAGTTTHLAMVDLYNPSGAGAITNLYGIRIANLNRGANNWAIYSPGTAPSLYGGSVSVAGLNSSGAAYAPTFTTEYSTANDIRGLFRATATEVQLSSTYDATGSFQPLKFYTSDTERMSIAVDGTITAPKIQSSQVPSAGDDLVNKTALDAAVSGATGTSGTYTPTITNNTNVTANTPYVTNYFRVGDMVTVSGFVLVTVTSVSTFTSLDCSLPISSNLANLYDLSGLGQGDATSSGAESITIVANAVNDRATITFNAGSSTSSQRINFTFTYKVL